MGRPINRVRVTKSSCTKPSVNQEDQKEDRTLLEYKKEFQPDTRRKVQDKHPKHSANENNQLSQRVDTDILSITEKNLTRSKNTIGNTIIRSTMFFRNKRQVIKDVVSTLQTEEDCRRNNNNNTKTAKRDKKKSGDDGNDILKRQQPYNPYFFPSSDVASLRTTTRTTNTPSQETKKMGTNGGQWEKPFIGLSPFSAKVTVYFLYYE